MTRTPANLALERSRQRIPNVEEYYDQLRYETDPLGGYRLCRNQRLEHVTINQFGYRGRPFTGQETVLLLGDSVTFGVGASGDDARFACFLEQATGLPVADASVRAYRVCQQYLELPRLLERLGRIEHVLLWFGYADLLFWVISGGSIEGTFQLEHKYAAQGSETEVSHRVLRLLRLGRHVGLNWVRDRAQRETRPREAGSLKELVAQMTVYIQAIRDLVRSRGITLHLLIQPFIRIRPSDPALRAITDDYDERSQRKCAMGWYEASAQFISDLQTSLKNLTGVNLMDTQSLVAEVDFLDQVHLKEEALKQLAERLVKENRFSFSTSTAHQPIEESSPWTSP